MSDFTREDSDQLKAPFPARQHGFVKTGQGYKPYITRFEVESRIEEVDPAWQFVIKKVERVASAGTKDGYRVVVHASLTIKGVTREAIGMADVLLTKPRANTNTGEMLTDEANDPEKAAESDAIKRCAWHFGVGRYLTKCSASSEQELDRWLQAMLAAKERQNGAVAAK